MSNTNYFPTEYQSFIHLSRYARWLPEKNRRETWLETVTRYFDFFEEHLWENNKFKLTKDVRKELEDAVLNLEVMPSMRCLMTAGEALKREPLAGFNCSYIAIDSPRSFDEILYVLMNGVGVGFSVEQKYVEQLPIIAEDFNETDTTIHVADSKMGWAKSLKELIHLLYGGQIPKWDISKVRPAGAPLKTFGGRASGPDPLVSLFKFCVTTFKKAAGRRLTTLECHDIVCKIAEIVVVGGVRRCLPENTLVTTERGLIAMKDVVVGDLVLSDNSKYRRVLAKESVGVKKTLKIQTRAGTIEVTPEHRMAVLVNPDNGDFIWKEAKDLLPNDCLIYNGTSIEHFGADKSLSYTYNKPSRSTNCKNIDINKLSIIDWAWLIGFTHGDGYVPLNGKNVCYAVSGDMTETRDKILEFMKRLGIKATTIDRPGYYFIRCYSRQLNQFLSDYKKPNCNIVVPDFVLCGNKNIRLSYLAGIFDADGSCKTKRPGRKPFEILTTVYEDFQKQICGVISSFGIPFSAKTRKSVTTNWQDQYKVNIVGHLSKDVLANEMKKYSEKIRNDYNFMVAKKEQCSVVLSSELLKTSTRSSQFAHNYCTNSKINLPWSTFTGQSFWYVPAMIVSIEESKEYTCYDLQVEDTESFFAGGFLVHNSALISLSDLSDDRMRSAKYGDWWKENVQRALANNSFVVKDEIDVGIFMKEWLSLYESRSGERGIFSRTASKKQAEKYGRRNPDYDYGCNPCSEIILRNRETCNLSEVVVRSQDTQKSLANKIKLATILGTFQSTLTNYKHVSKKWKENAEEERLLGVSLTGILDNAMFNKNSPLYSFEIEKVLNELREVAVITNKEWAEKLKVPQSVAITTLKPSGTVSQLVDSSSGMHARHSPYYIRTVRADKKDPLAKMMVDVGFPVENDITKPDHTYVFSFPIKAPENAIYRKDMSAIDQLELWLLLQRSWCEHKPSVTITVKEHEWPTVGAWVWEHIEEMSGVSFLPFSDHVYLQAPYQDCTREEYETLLSKMPKNVDWSLLSKYELEDATTGTQELACHGAGGGCEI